MEPIMKYFKKHLNLFLILLIISLIYSTIYTASQQVSRLNANDPQVQMAEDTATRLDYHAKPQDVVAGRPVNIATSLAPFLIVYDKSGHIMANSGYLNNHIPKVPFGVLKSSDGKPDGNRVT